MKMDLSMEPNSRISPYESGNSFEGIDGAQSISFTRSADDEIANMDGPSLHITQDFRFFQSSDHHLPDSSCVSFNEHLIERYSDMQRQAEQVEPMRDAYSDAPGIHEYCVCSKYPGLHHPHQYEEE
jgi:hypothetical protein